MGKAFDPQEIKHPYGFSKASDACKLFRAGTPEGQRWPDLMNDHMNPINEIVKDGEIEPCEFDVELEKLSTEDRKYLMEEVLKHPLAYFARKN